MHSFHLPVYRHPRYLILSSFKVMSAFLKRQNALQPVVWNKYTMSMALGNRVLNRPEAIALMRDPESRFLSYFKDKFRKEPARMLAEDRLTDQDLQRCQRVWLDFVGVNTSDVAACCQHLLETPLNDVVAALAQNYELDPHTLPQWECFYAQWRGLRFRLQVSQVFLIDQPADLQAFGQLLGVDTSRRVNQTQTVTEPLILSEQSRQLIRQIYAQDFALYEDLRQAAGSERVLRWRWAS